MHPLARWCPCPRMNRTGSNIASEMNQVEAFHRDGRLPDRRAGALTTIRWRRCAQELAGLMEPSHPSHELSSHEYHSERVQQTPDTTLFHALGAWRTGPAFHDVLWESGVSGGGVTTAAEKWRCGSWHDQLFCKPAHHAAAW